MKKFLCTLLCLMMLALPLSAFGAARMPEWRSNINDSADVLSAQTVSDLAEFSKLVTQNADVDLHVATVHFLDGMEPQTYAEQLFDKWQLNETDLLLVCAAGEDSFATAMGAEAEKLLGRTNIDNLLYTSSEFGQLFRTQQYDAAVAAYCKGLNNLLQKQTGDSVSMDGLFGEESLTMGEPLDVDEYFEKYGGALWRDVMDAINETGVDYQTHYYEEEREENGLTAGGWIVLIVLIMIVLRQNKYDRARRARRQASGCGCSPLGWIVGLLGLGFLFNRE